jgi:hypothetical protein
MTDTMGIHLDSPFNPYAGPINFLLASYVFWLRACSSSS